MSDPILALHLRVLGGDREAVELLAAALVAPLRRRLQRQFPRTEPDLIAEAVHDALMVYQENPHVFEATRGVPLAAFLYGLAGRLLWVTLRAARRRAVREGHASYVLQAYARLVADRAASRADAAEVRSALPRFCSPTELEAMLAHLDDRDIGVVAAILGLSHLGRAEQHHARDVLLARVTNRLRRHFGVKRGGANAQSAQRIEKTEWLTLGIDPQRQIHQ